MANLTADTIHETRPRAGRDSYVVDDTVQLFAGSFVGVDASGYLDKWADTAGHEFQGLLLEGVTGDISALPPVEGRVDTSGVTLLSATVAAAVQGSVNALVYCETDNPADMDLTASVSVAAVGWVKRFISAGVADVTLFTPEEHLAL
jgi:hypothetical protein